MQIWVDADACPRAIKKILFRAAQRVEVVVNLVSNLPLRTPASPWLKTVQVPHGADAADHRISKLMAPGDLVITADIPLAAEVVEQGGLALDPRGDLYTADNVRERLSIRDFMDDLRSTGVQTGGPAAFSQKDRRNFANQLDRILTRYQQGS